MVECLLKANIYDIRVTPECKRLRYYHYRRGNSDIYMFFNEEKEKRISFTAKLPTTQNLVCYDAIENRLIKVKAINNSVAFNLEPYQSVVLISSSSGYSHPVYDSLDLSDFDKCVLNGPLNISISEFDRYPEFTEYKTSEHVFNINAEDELPDFSGTVLYECSFNTKNEADQVYLKLNSVFEVAESGLMAITPGAASVILYL